MNENKKTGIFAGVAAVLALGTWLSLPGTSTKSVKQSGGSPSGDLFKEYDPLTAASLRIVKYNKDLAEVSDFEITKDKVSGVWTIPSHAGYPADADKQMSAAANTFINLKVLDVVTERRDEHKLFGVVEPDPEKIQAGDEGIGTLVRILDAKGDSLANVVVGATEKDNPKHRFVRIPTQDIVYIVELDTNPLTTEFTKWIEPDLLKLSSNDIDKLGIRDYAIITTAQGAILSPNFDADLSFTTTDGKWNADSIRLREGQNSTPRVLTDAEQVNATKLNEIRNALDSLRIVDVRRKPKGLAANLKADNALLEDRESLTAMVRKGFIPQKGADGSSEIFASSGELLATLKDGVQYLVRFGNTTGESSESKNEEKKDGEAAKADTSLQLDRYMLVTTQVDESKFPTVILKPLPESYEDLLKMEEAEKGFSEGVPVAPPAETNVPAPTPVPGEPEQSEKVEKAAEGEKAPGEKASAEVKPVDAPAATTEPKPEKSGDQSSVAPSKRSMLVSLTQQEPQEPKPTTPPGADQKPADAKPVEDAKTVEVKPSEVKPAQETAAAPTTPDAKPATQDAKPATQDAKPAAAAPLTDDEKKERLEAARERITKENQRRIEERAEKLEAAKKKVAELNARFADWFYVISESEYKRLRITLDELVQPKSAAAPNQGAPAGFPGGFNPGAFQPPR